MLICDEARQVGNLNMQSALITIEWASVIGSQFMQKLETCGFKGVQRWYQKVVLVNDEHVAMTTGLHICRLTYWHKMFFWY